MAFLDHAIPMRKLSTQDVTEDLRISMRMRGEAASCLHAVFVEDTQAAEVLELRIIVIGEAEGVICVKEVFVDCVPSGAGAPWYDFGVGEL